MKPYVGTAYYYNRKGQSDETNYEFIWAKDDDEADAIMNLTHGLANNTTVKAFTTIKDALSL